jgi:IclR helix-turn-helix domain
VSATSLSRYMAIVGEVAEHGPLTVEAIFTGAELPLSTAYRYVADLVKIGYLVQAKRGRYTLGPSLSGLVRRVNRQCRDERFAAAQAAIYRMAPNAPGLWVQPLTGRVLNAIDSVSAIDSAEEAS